MESLAGSKRINLMFNDVYRNKTVLITGDTGFKGSWLATWLTLLGAKVIGYSSYLPSEPCNYKVCNLSKKIIHIDGDVCDSNKLLNTFLRYKPEVVFHLAAQAITRKSYDIPQETFFTNLGGTVNILECMRKTESVLAAVLITSDKCYQNVEWVWGYRENDRLGGDDPYSASKACAEIACHSYIKSFFLHNKFPRAATARAGNVIGGGDWGPDRIIPDSIRAFSRGENLAVRSPKATRPWQHVLEPLSGYLCLGANLLQGNTKVSGESFNFGPSGNIIGTVEELIREFLKTWGDGRWFVASKNDELQRESGLLKLNCDKALYYLNWYAVLSFKEAVKMTADWYKAYYNEEKDMYSFTITQIEIYTKLARERGLNWTSNSF